MLLRCTDFYRQSTMSQIEICQTKGSSEQPLRTETIGDLLDVTCRRVGLQDAVVFPDENVRLMFTQLRQEVEKLAAGFLSLGLSRGDHVTLWGANHAHLLISIYACAKAGLIFSNMNHALPADAVASHLKLNDSKVVICFPSVKAGHCYEQLCQIAPELKDSALGHLESRALPKLTHVIIAEDDMEYGGCYTLSYVFKLGSQPEALPALAEVSSKIKADDLATIQFTSGTTGEIKAVMLSHFQLVNAAMVIGQRLYLDQPGESLCCPMPIFRGPAMCLAAMSTVVLGAKVVYPGAGSLPPTIFRIMQDEKCTCLLTNPIALHLMLRLPATKKFKIESLTSVCLMFDHVPNDLIAAMQKNTNIGDVTTALALTESGCMPIMFPINGKAEKLVKTTGSVAAHYEVKILDFNGEVAKVGQPGELLFKPIGNSRFLGFYNDEKNTKHALVDDWVRSGDVATMDADGYVTLLGGAKDVIFHKKKPIIPTYIERHLSTYANVIGVQVVGVDDAECGEKICAVVVLKEKEGLTEENVRRDLIEMCKEEKLTVPHHIIFVKDFPRTVAKKVQKFKLKEWAQQQIGKK